MLHVYSSGSRICQPMLKIKRNETNTQNKVGLANNCVQQWINGSSFFCKTPALEVWKQCNLLDTCSYFFQQAQCWQKFQLRILCNGQYDRLRVWQLMGSIPCRIKPKTQKFIFSAKHAALTSKLSSFLEISRLGTACSDKLNVGCSCSELAL